MIVYFTIKTNIINHLHNKRLEHAWCTW